MILLFLKVGGSSPSHGSLIKIIIQKVRIFSNYTINNDDIKILELDINNWYASNNVDIISIKTKTMGSSNTILTYIITYTDNDDFHVTINS